MDIKAAGPGKIRNLVIFLFAKVMRSLPSAVRRKIVISGELTAFQNWILKDFPASRFFVSREALWLSICEKLKGQQFRILELGVAHGYATKWFLDHYPIDQKNLSSELTSYDGFDLFSGLPDSWRDLPSGYFNNFGVTPNINDSRLTFHVGYVENEILKMKTTDFYNKTTFIIFDLDLYEPTLASYLHLRDLIKAGDIIYFDEAFDEEEQRVSEKIY